MADLRAFLLHAALFSLQRGTVPLPDLTPSEIDQLAEDCAQEALVSILDRLDSFRSEARFTTWAYRFAVNKALVAARRRHWRDVSLDALMENTEVPSSLMMAGDHAGDPDRRAELEEIWAAMRDIIQSELSHHQRRVLQAAVFEEVPLDELARYLGTSRNAIYKTLHDVRRKIKARLEARGLAVGETLARFGAGR